MLLRKGTLFDEVAAVRFDLERLESLGLTHFFRRQLEAFNGSLRPARVIGVDRGRLTVSHEHGEAEVVVPARFRDLPPEDQPTIGDWVLLEENRECLRQVLTRSTVFRRLAAGNRGGMQLIAANVDTLLIVSSCNAEFNPSRLERYLALALDAGASAVVVLTKADEAGEADADGYRRTALSLRSGLCVELVNALDPSSLGGVRAWCSRGQTIALVGSSGVGKSTLVNSLAGAPREETGAVRESDQRGRHTTTRRSMHWLADGGLLLDSPGMRELKLADAAVGLGEVFDDIAALARGCRFADCAHEREPGCAVLDAFAAGLLDERRLGNYRKLMREQCYARETIAERNARSRRFGRAARAVLQPRRRR